MHGYTWSGHPLACAAAMAQIDVLQNEDLLARVRALTPRFEAIVHGLADAPGVVSIRNLGLAAGIELAPDASGPGRRGARAQAAAFDRGVLTRAPGDTLILAPPFISTPEDIQRMADRLRLAIEDTAQPEA
jgi:beta-alanine--pyruvate transaminase